jgi:peptide/nickel transport system substrate-binding protein
MSKEEFRLVEEALEGQISRRQLITRLLAMGVAAPAIASILAGSGLMTAAEAAELFATPKRGGTFKMGTIVPATDVDPVTMFNQGAIFTAQMACEYLCFPRPDYTLAPKLATSWHATNPKTWTFHLRKGVKFHNGQPFTADDVVASMDRLTDPKTASAALSAFKGILSAGHTKKVDTYTVQFHLDRGFLDFPYLVSAFTYNSLILPKNYKIGDFIKGGWGSGPFILTNYTSKVGATYKRNPHYWAKGLPYASGAHLTYYADASSIVLAMQAGDVGAYLNLPYQGSQALFANSNLTILKNSGTPYREFAMRVDQAPFDKKGVRQAIALCLDRPALVKGLLNGFGQVGNDHGFAPAFAESFITKSIPQRKQDYAKAKSLLAAAGHPNGVDVTLTTEQYLEIPEYAVTIKQMCKPAGINVTLNIEDQNTYYGSGSNQPWLFAPMTITDWAPRGVPSQLIDPAYLTSSIPPPTTGWNSAHWSNKTFDHDVNTSDITLNKTTREKLILAAAKIMNDETPAIIAYWLEDLGAVSKKVHGVPKGPAPHLDPSRIWIG